MTSGVLGPVVVALRMKSNIDIWTYNSSGASGRARAVGSPAAGGKACTEKNEILSQALLKVEPTVFLAGEADKTIVITKGMS